MREAVFRFLLRVFIKIRWAYFHVSPRYIKFYMDSGHTEAHFFHPKTNSIHSNYTLSAPAASGEE